MLIIIFNYFIELIDFIDLKILKVLKIDILKLPYKILSIYIEIRIRKSKIFQKSLKYELGFNTNPNANIFKNIYNV